MTTIETSEEFTALPEADRRRVLDFIHAHHELCDQYHIRPYGNGYIDTLSGRAVMAKAVADAYWREVDEASNATTDELEVVWEGGNGAG